MKNLAICCVAIAMRAAVDVGIYEELAFTLSDLHIQQIEELNDVKAVEAALVRALLLCPNRSEFAGVHFQPFISINYIRQACGVDWTEQQLLNEFIQRTDRHDADELYTETAD
jgi:hypothetical protein